MTVKVTGAPCKRCRSGFDSGHLHIYPAGQSVQIVLVHIDRNQKVTHRVWSWAVARREAELAKCQVLCGSHHLEKTMAETYQAPHGTHHRYTHHGCHCVECRKAHAAVNRGYRQQSSAAAAAKRDVA